MKIESQNINHTQPKKKMFEIIQTQRINNLICYKAKTTHSVAWYYFKGTEIKQVEFLRYHRNYRSRMMAPICCFCNDDWKDIKAFIKTLN